MKTENIKKYIYLCVCVAVALLAVSLSFYNQKSTNSVSVHKRLQQRFLEKESKLTACIDSILQKEITDIPSLLQFCKKEKCSAEEFVLYVYRNNSLVAWSSNVISMPSYWSRRMYSYGGFQQLEGKSAYTTQDSSGSLKVIGFYILQTPLSNSNSFTHTDLFKNQPADISVIPIGTTSNNSYTIQNSNNEDAFALEMRSRIRLSDESASLEMMLWILLITLLVVFTNIFLKKSGRLREASNKRAFVLIILILILFQLFFIENIFPAIHSSNLFSSVYFAYLYHSLGELYVGTYSFLMIAVVLYKSRTLSSRKKGNGWKLTMHLFLLNLTYFIAFFFLYNVILNTSISAFPSLPLRAAGGENLLLVKILYSISLVSVVSGLHLIFVRYYYECRRISSSRKQWLVSVISSLLLAWSLMVILFAIMNTKDILLFIAGSFVYFMFVLATCLHVKNPDKVFSVKYYVTTCLLSTLLLSMLFENVNVKRLTNSKESFANSLLENDDPLMRYNLNEVAVQLTQDEDLIALLRDPGTMHEDVVNYMQNQYVQPYFVNNRNKLFVGHTRVTSDMIRIRQYQQIFEDTEKDSLFPNLCISGETMGSKKYLMVKTIPIRNNSNDSVCIALEIMKTSDFFKPSFLLSRREHRLEKEMLMLSCAEYDNNVLTHSSDSRGVFKLHLSDFSLDTLYNGMSFRENGQDYTAYYKNPSKVIVLASPRKPLGNIISLYAYLFIVLGVFSILLSMIVNFQSHYNIMLRHRIQLFIVTTILLMSLVSMFLFSLFAHSFSKIELNQNAMQRINLISRLLPTDHLDADSSNIIYLDKNLVTPLYKLPMEYVENVNIYTIKGEGIVRMERNLPIPQSSDRLNPIVMEAFAYRHKSSYVDDVLMSNRIDAAIIYQALRNQSGDVVAYMSFPTRQRGGFAEYLFSSIIPVFLGIYFILTVLFAFFSSLFSNYIVLSLTRIAQLLSKVNLKSKNQKIVWKHEDEIGLLVKDYNRLVDDLEVSAELLARSSKESAWKELAQQVAHEIKNPLTPMRLRTQQLQRKMQDGKLTEEEMNNYTHMMIGQIDALTEITTSFSYLSKIHQSNGQQEDLVEIAQCAIDTFEDSEDYVLVFEQDHSLSQALIWTDRQQMLRVFNNLINNAIQAKKPQVQQRILLSISDYDEFKWKILLTDFGRGMDKETQKYAFVPHFTTKSSGSGLGLAIVKNILSDWGGEISFKSVENEYTIFTIYFPKYKAS